jgi:hypothetical protein
MTTVSFSADVTIRWSQPCLRPAINLCTAGRERHLDNAGAYSNSYHWVVDWVFSPEEYKPFIRGFLNFTCLSIVHCSSRG